MEETKEAEPQVDLQEDMGDRTTEDEAARAAAVLSSQDQPVHESQEQGQADVQERKGNDLIAAARERLQKLDVIIQSAEAVRSEYALLHRFLAMYKVIAERYGPKTDEEV